MQRIAWIAICLSILSLSCDKNKNNTVTPQVKIGELVPEIELADLEGTTVHLSNYLVVLYSSNSGQPGAPIARKSYRKFKHYMKHLKVLAIHW